MIKKVSFLLLSLFFCGGFLFAESHSDVLGDSFLSPAQTDDNLTHLFFNKSSDLIGPSVALSYQGRFWTAVQLQKLYSCVLRMEDDSRKLDALSVIKKYLAQDSLKYLELTEDGFALMYLFNEYEILPFWFVDFPGWALFSEGIKQFEIDLDINHLMSGFVDDKVILPSSKKIKDNKLITRSAFNLAQRVKKNYSQNYFAFLYFSKPGLGILNAVGSVLKWAGVFGTGYVANQYRKFRSHSVTQSSASVVVKSVPQEALINENQFRNGFSVALFRLKKGKPSSVPCDSDKLWFPSRVVEDPLDHTWQYNTFSDGRADAPLMILPPGYSCNRHLRLIKDSNTSFRMVYQKPLSKEHLLTEQNTFVDGEFWTLDQVYLLLERVIKQPELLSDTFSARFFDRKFTENEEKLRYFRARLKLMFPQAEFKSIFSNELGMIKDFLVAADIQQALPWIFASSYDSNSLFAWFRRCAWWMQSQEEFTHMPHLMFDVDYPEQAPTVSYDECYKLMCELLADVSTADRDLQPYKFSEVFSKPAWLCDDRWSACLRFNSREFRDKNSVQSKVFQGLSAENCFDSRGGLLQPSKIVVRPAGKTLESVMLSSAQKEALILMRTQGLSLIPYVSEWPEDDVTEFPVNNSGREDDPICVPADKVIRSLKDGNLRAEPTRRHNAVLRVLKHQEKLESQSGELTLFAQAEGPFFLTGNDLQAGDCFSWNKDTDGCRKLRLRKRFQPAVGDGAASLVDRNSPIDGTFWFECLTTELSSPSSARTIEQTHGLKSLADWFYYFDANGYTDDVMIVVNRVNDEAPSIGIFVVKIFIKPQTGLMFEQLTALL